MDRVIEAEGLVVRFGDARALDGVSMSSGRGDIVAVVGPNASGKSTLLRALAGLVRCDAGSVSLFGMPLAGLSIETRAKAMAFVPQRPEVSAPFTAREVVALGRFASGPAPELVARAIADVGLAARADILCQRLSGGERQRVAVARALAQVGDHCVLLLDEPFAAVDPGEVARLVDALRRRAGGGAVLISMHDPGLARAIATHAIVLAKGRVLAAGRADETLTPRVLSEAYGHPMRLADAWLAPALDAGRAASEANSQQYSPRGPEAR